MLPRQRHIFLNRYRLRRSLIIGTILTLLFYYPFTGKEALSIGMLAALVVDAVLFCKTAWSWIMSRPKRCLIMKGCVPAC